LLALLALAAQVKAAAVNELGTAAGSEKGAIAVPAVQAPENTKLDFGDIIDGIADQIGQKKRTYRVGPFFRRDADYVMETVTRNLWAAGAKVRGSRFEGDWNSVYVVVDYKASFKVRAFRRDHIFNAHHAYDKMDRIIENLRREGVQVIYGRVEGYPGDFSIIIDYADERPNGAQIIGGIIGEIIDHAAKGGAKGLDQDGWQPGFCPGIWVWSPTEMKMVCMPSAPVK
jgi:hypothetical protein